MIVIDSSNIEEAKRLTEELRQCLVYFTAKMNKLSNSPVKAITYHIRTGESMEETDLKIHYKNPPTS